LVKQFWDQDPRTEMLNLARCRRHPGAGACRLGAVRSSGPIVQQCPHFRIVSIATLLLLQAIGSFPCLWTLFFIFLFFSCSQTRSKTATPTCHAGPNRRTCCKL